MNRVSYKNWEWGGGRYSMFISVSADTERRWPAALYTVGIDHQREKERERTRKRDAGVPETVGQREGDREDDGSM